MLLNKAQLRKTLIEQRSQIFPAERMLAALQAKKIFTESNLFSHQHFACYFASENEFDCTPMIDAIWDAGKNCYLPILLSTRDDGLQFSLYTPETKLALNRYKILEPAHPQIFPAENLDIVFLPLVGFDLKGNRLGMGAGYYDRTFAFLREQKIKKPTMAGLAYEFQCVETITRDAWDVRLDCVLTEKNLHESK